jgi:hypothetical protein
LKRTELRRSTPLRRQGPLKGQPLTGPIRKPRPKPKTDPPELRAAKEERRQISNDVCEVDGCGNRATHFHHRWLRSQGGVHEVWNLLHVCAGLEGRCHEHIHANPEDSYAKGYMLRRVDGCAEKERRDAERQALIDGSAA